MDGKNQLKTSQGVYVIVLKIVHPYVIDTKRFKWILKAGYYLYFGSARGKTSTSLENRLARHFRFQKKIFWHIDYITSNSDTKIINAFYSVKPDITECSAFQEFKQNFQDVIIIPNFGSTDCKSYCGGHLFFLSPNQAVLPSLGDYFSSKNWKASTNEGNSISFLN
ncbi:MAG: DUF123 domain-containing protein [Promethearchaeota archaeon]